MARKKGEKARIPIAGSWTAVPNDLLRDSQLTTTERLTCALLRVYAGLSNQAFPLQAQIASDLGVHPRTVQTNINRLIQRGYVGVRRAIWGNVYTLLEPNQVLTDTISGSPPTISGSHSSLYDQTHHDSDSPPPEAPPSLPGGDGGDSIREEETPLGRYLRDELGITTWAEFQHLPYDATVNRIERLRAEGANRGAIVGNLRKAPPTEAPAPAAYDDVPTDLDALAVGVEVRVLSGTYIGASGAIRAMQGLSSQVYLPEYDAAEWLPNWALAPLDALEGGAQ